MSTRVFVGNLSFGIKEDDLAKHFGECGTVKSTHIITRGTRSLGYGFVEMETEDQAKKAVEAMNKKSIDERAINVEIARPKVPREEGERPKPRQRAPKKPEGSNDGQATGDSAERPRGRRPRGRRPAGGAGGAPGNKGPSGEGRRPRPARDTPRTPSETTLYVGNLPFAVDDAGLRSIFEGHKVKSARVVTKQSGRSKGFGFVEFENKADQEKALKALEGRVQDGRTLIVKVALTEPQTNDADAKTEEKKN